MRLGLLYVAVSLALLLPGPLAAQTTGVWSTPTRTKVVDPDKMDRSERVTRPGSVDRRVVGAWEVWIPGAVWYSSDGSRVYRNYTPGAAMNRLQIREDGSYQWAERKGKVVEVRPWHAEDGRRYYEIVHPGGSTYDVYPSEDGAKLVVLFGGVGGHAATGSRIGGADARASGAPPATGRPKASAGASSPAPRPSGAAPGTRKAPIVSCGLSAGDRVQVEWSGGWYAAQVVEVGNATFKVRYDGYGSAWDEWVAPARVRSAKLAPGCKPAP